MVSSLLKIKSLNKSPVVMGVWGFMAISGAHDVSEGVVERKNPKPQPKTPNSKAQTPKP